MGFDANDAACGNADANFSEASSGPDTSFIRQISAADEFFIKTSGNPPPIPWFVDEWMLKAEPTLLAGPGGVGKTRLSVQLQAAGSVRDGKWLGMSVPMVPSIGFYSEDSKEAVANILDAVARDLGTTVAQLVAGGMHVLPKPQGDMALVSFDRDGIPNTTAAWSVLKAAVDEYQAGLLVLDNLADFLPVLQYDNGGIRRARRCSLDPLCKSGLTILGLQNVTLAGLRAKDEAEGSSGGLAWRDAFRGRLLMRKPEGEDPAKDRREWRRSRTITGEDGSVIPLTWRDGVWVADRPEVGMVGAIDRHAREQAAEEAFLACLRETQASGRHASHTTAARDRYAPKMFRRLDAGRQYSMKQLADAMWLLFATCRIRVDTYRTSARHYAEHISEIAA